MKISDALKYIRDNVEIQNKHYGICAALTKAYNPKHEPNKELEIKKFLESSFVFLYGKQERYPIEKDYITFYLNDDKWNISTEFGRQRLDLLDKMIVLANAHEHLPIGIDLLMLDTSDVFGIPVPDISNGTITWSKPLWRKS